MGMPRRFNAESNSGTPGYGRLLSLQRCSYSWFIACMRHVTVCSSWSPSGRARVTSARIPLPTKFLELGDEPIVMGVLNVTPDSFSDGGRYVEPAAAAERARAMVEEGAAIIDIGGESARPGSNRIDTDEELRRVMPVFERLSGELSVPLSIDTTKAAVARAAVEAGAGIINDISGLRSDRAMTDTAVETGAAVVVMHMLGTPETMQEDPSYDDAVSEIHAWLDARTAGLIERGVEAEKIIVDPGIGFGKRLIDNLELLNEIGTFADLGFPVLVGSSRKSFLGAITGRDPMDRRWGGFAALAACLEGGTHIVRVHDVRETADFIKVWLAIRREEHTT